ncbi:MAG: DUF1684 domain-containing protein [Candidatus Delongbacteria bacterium]|nr:DUF1684 domain-containing protein [Candidatus Delongbacteria bacterium]
MNLQSYKEQILIDRKAKDDSFKTPETPIIEEDRTGFTNLNYFNVDMKFRLELELQEFTEKEQEIIKDSKGNDRYFIKWGKFEFAIDNVQNALIAYKSSAEDTRLFIPFKDSTTAEETYGAGRYIDLMENNDKVGQKWILDFNLAYNPWCAYNYNYSCPLVPVENMLNVRILAGETKMKKFLLLITVLSTLLLTSCMSMMLQSTIKNTPISNKIMLHDNIRVGDYAIYKSKIETEDEQSKAMIGETTVTVKVTNITRNRVTISQTMHTTGVAAIFANTMEFELISDKEGNIISGIFYQGPEKIALKIAKPGDAVYNTFGKLNKTDHKKWEIPRKVTVPAGTFTVDAMYYSDKDTQPGTHSIYLGTKKVKFYNVATMVVEEKSDGTKIRTVMELVEQGSK